MTKPINKNVALLELGGSHTECMHLQIKALKDYGYSIFLICNCKLFDDFPNKTDFKAYQLFDDKKSVIDKIKQISSIKKFLNQNDINTLVINTLEVTAVRDLLVFPPSTIKNYVALLHNAKKLNKAHFRYTRKRVKKILLLSKDIENSINIKSKHFKISTLYPIYFPQYPDFIVEKPDNEFWITIPGFISFKRKNLAYLFKSMQEETLNKGIKFIFLGKVNENEQQEFKDEINKLPNSAVIKTFDSRIPENVFATYIKSSDLILPLVNIDHYKSHRISGAYNLAYGYKIPLYLEAELNNCSDFEGVALFYQKSKNIISQINDLVENNNNVVEKYKQNLLYHSVFNTDAQCKYYIDFVMS